VTFVPERSAHPGLVTGLVRAARPKQWVKNVLVFAAPGAAGVLDQRLQLLHTVEACSAFCAASSATYLLNDAADVEADRRHPTKRFRPIAAGIVPLALARATAVVLVFAAIGIMALTGQIAAVACVAAYLVVSFAYTAGLKHVAVIDLILVASGFVLRALAGAKAVDVVVSDWFLIVTTFGSLFVVAGKRFAELREIGPEAETRSTLAAYSVPFLRLVVGVGLAGCAMSYCLFALERAASADLSLPLFQLSIVPVIAALLRYALDLEDGHGGAPEDVFLADRWLQFLGVIWAVLFVVGVYAG
jgi:decaprenyl-phosphate phosphoribosyltransferase